MRKNTKNILILFIIAVLVLSMTGCKKEKKPGNEVSNNSSDNNSSTIDRDDWDPNDVIDPDNTNSGDNTSDNTSDDPSKDEPSSPYEFELDYVEPLEGNQKIGFSVYHYEMDGWDEVTGQSQFEVFNYYHCKDILTLKKVKDAGCMGWLGLGNPFGGDKSITEIDEDWIEDFMYMVESVKIAGLWDAVAGFHAEEPLLVMSGEQFRMLTKWVADTFPGKRIYTVVSVYEIDGKTPYGTLDPITYRTYGYVTDIGYDWYDSNNYDQHKSYVMKMMEGVGRKNVRIWLYPTTYRRKDERTAQYCADSLDMCYKLLMDLKDEGYVPGGLDCYTWATFGNEDGLGRLLDKAIRGDEYDLLKNKFVEIGNKIINNSYRYKETIN